MSDNKNLKPGWKVWRFDQMATNVNVRIDNPSESGMEHYIGLEHLDADSLKIRRWGKPDDVEATKLMFKKGDIIFGRRRAYQRKLGVAEFDGICSAHAMVLRAKPDVVLPEFLPFFMQSDRFMNRAVEISVGSLSPTINWKTMAAQEFALPPREIQASLVEALKAAGSLVETRKDALDRLRTLARSKLDLEFSDQSTWIRDRIGNIGDVQLGRQRAPKYTTGQFNKPYLRVVNVLDGRLDLRDVESMDFNDRDFARYSLQPDDILVTEGDLISVYNVGRSAIWSGEIADCCFQNTLIRFRCGPAAIPKFALAAFRHAFYHAIFAKAANATTVAHLGAERFGSIEIGYPDKSRQRAIADGLDDLYSAERELERRLLGEESLLKSLREEILEGNAA